MKHIILSLLLFLSIQSFAQDTWHFVFNENEATLNSENKKQLEKFYRFASINHHQKITVQFENRYDDISKMAEAKTLFKNRKIKILKKIRGKNLENRIHQKPDAFIFSKSLRFTSWNNTEIQPNQLVTVYVTLGESKTDKTTASSPVTTQKTTTKTTSETETKSVIQDLPKDFPKSITFNCEPKTNKVNFQYRAGQNITFKTNGGIEITISGSAIKHSKDGVPMMIQVWEALSPAEILKQGVSTKYTKTQYLRLGSHVGFRLYERGKEVFVQGCVAMKIPTTEITNGELMVAKKRKNKPSLFEYKDGHYHVKYCYSFVNGTSFSIGQLSKETIYTRIINPAAFRSYTSGYAVSPYIIFSDSTVVKLEYNKKYNKKTADSRYIKFPIFPDFENKGMIYDGYVRVNWSRSFPVKWDTEYEKIAMYKGQTPFNITQKKDGTVKKTKKVRVNGTKREVLKDIEIEYQLVKYKAAMFQSGYAQKDYIRKYKARVYPVNDEDMVLY